jgi:hypothetical protein
MPCARVARVDLHEIDDNASNANWNHLAENQCKAPSSLSTCFLGLWYYIETLWLLQLRLLIILLSTDILHIIQIFKLVYTPSVPNYVAYNFWSKSKFVKFDQIFNKIYNLFYNIKSMFLKYHEIHFHIIYIWYYTCRWSLLYTWSKFVRFDFSKKLYATYFGMEGLWNDSNHARKFQPTYIFVCECS